MFSQGGQTRKDGQTKKYLPKSIRTNMKFNLSTAIPQSMSFKSIWLQTFPVFHYHLYKKWIWKMQMTKLVQKIENLKMNLETPLNTYDWDTLRLKTERRYCSFTNQFKILEHDLYISWNITKRNMANAISLINLMKPVQQLGETWF